MDKHDIETMGLLALLAGAAYMLFRTAPAMARPMATAAPQNTIFGKASIYDTVKRAVPLTSQEVDSLNLLSSVLSGNTPIAAT